jgi:hypothetical protein
MRIARRCCRPCGLTIGLVPDFAASRVSGTLDAFEQVAAVAAQQRSRWSVASEVRPTQGVLQSAVRWVSFRARRVRQVLAIAVGLLQPLWGCEPTLTAVGERLGVEHGVLRMLRELCQEHLHALPPTAPGCPPRPSTRTNA